jgi:hypothetical protein
MSHPSPVLLVDGNDREVRALAGALGRRALTLPLHVRSGELVGTAVFAIPRRAVVRQDQDSLVLDTTLGAVRARWLMHVTLKKGA